VSITKRPFLQHMQNDSLSFNTCKTILSPLYFVLFLLDYLLTRAHLA